VNGLGGSGDTRIGARLLSILIWPVKMALVAALLIHDGLSFVFAPVLRWIKSLQLMVRLARFVALQSPYATLAMLLLPLAVAWPLKLLGAYWLATGRIVAALLVLGFAYGLSLILVERILDAGRDKLMTIRWFAVMYRWLTALHGRVLAFLRASAPWRWSAAIIASVRPHAVHVIQLVRIQILSLFRPRR
jgi:hypothetical protein